MTQSRVVIFITQYSIFYHVEARFLRSQQNYPDGGLLLFRCPKLARGASSKDRKGSMFRGHRLERHSSLGVWEGENGGPR